MSTINHSPGRANDANDAIEADHDARFERELSLGLSSLADGAPAGPSPDRVLSLLARRGRRRRALSIAAGLALVAGVGMALHRAGDEQGVPSGSPEIAALPQPAAAVTPQETPATVAVVPVVQPDSTVATVSTVAPAASGAATGEIAWQSFASALSLAERVDGAAGAMNGEMAMDWNLSLSLTLASSQLSDDALPLIRISSPW